MITEILHEEQDHAKTIKDLKRDSSYYPSILIRHYKSKYRPITHFMQPKHGVINSLANLFTKKKEPEFLTTCFASTLVRIERDGKWLTVHCVESYVGVSPQQERNLLLRMMDSVHKIQVLFKTTDHPFNRTFDIDSLQQSEEDRLILLHKQMFPF